MGKIIYDDYCDACKATELTNEVQYSRSRVYFDRTESMMQDIIVCVRARDNRLLEPRSFMAAIERNGDFIEKIEIDHACSYLVNSVEVPTLNGFNLRQNTKYPVVKIHDTKSFKDSQEIFSVIYGHIPLSSIRLLPRTLN